jgi:RNA polymerase sigma factor (sigma-70 family)
MRQGDAGDGIASQLPASPPAGQSQPDTSIQAEEAAIAVSALYQASALGLIRLAYVILGDWRAAEDIVQQAFFDLFRRWDRLSHVEGAEYYARVSVLTGCRLALRRRFNLGTRVLRELPGPSAAVAVGGNAERSTLIRAIDRLPRRRRESLILRYYLDLPDDEIAALMGISPATVKPTVGRALESVGRKLRRRDPAQLEDAIRRTLRARASEVPPSLPALDLRPRPASDRNNRVAYRRWTSAQLRWLGSAAIVITALAVLAGVLLGRGSAPKSNPVPTVVPSLAAILKSVPPYYVALANNRTVGRNTPLRAKVATVRNTATGAVIATVRAPAAYGAFTEVSGAANDRTFVLLAARTGSHTVVRRERFYRLSIDPQATSAANRTQLTPLPVTDIPATRQVDTISLSPSGAYLAAIVHNLTTNFLYVYNLRTGKTRIYTNRLCTPTCRTFGLFTQSMSWTRNGQSLAVVPGGFGGAGDQLRLLDISRPGDIIHSDSTVFPVTGIPVANLDWAMVTPDAKTAFVGYLESRGMSSWLYLARFSAGTLTGVNKLTLANEGRSTLYSYPYQTGLGFGDVDSVVWTNDSGSEAIALGAAPGQSAGIYTGTHYTPLPWLPNVIDVAW